MSKIYMKALKNGTSQFIHYYDSMVIPMLNCDFKVSKVSTRVEGCRRKIIQSSKEIHSHGVQQMFSVAT